MVYELLLFFLIINNLFWRISFISDFLGASQAESMQIDYSQRHPFSDGAEEDEEVIFCL